MYEELVKKLRFYQAGTLHYKQAADAIEQLQKDLERSKEYEAFWEEEATEALKKFQVAIASKPRWISVTERLPEPCETVLVNRVFGLHGQLSEVRFAHILRIYDRLEWNMVGVTHWMQLPMPPKEDEA